MKVIFVLGLCGAGKSHRARELQAVGFRNLDEKVTGRPVTPNVTAWPRSAYPEFLDAVEQGASCVVTEIAFYEGHYRAQVIADITRRNPQTTVEWECFDVADIEIANANCRNDPDRTPAVALENITQNGRVVDALMRGFYTLPAVHRPMSTRPRTAK